MRLSLGQSMQMAQKQVLAPRMIQSMEILQLPIIALQERIEQELRVATLIQQNFLPRELPDLPGWQVEAYYKPAREVGGDFYDFFRLESGEVAVVIGDVTDKGVPAAMVMAAARSVLRASGTRIGSPGFSSFSSAFGGSAGFGCSPFGGSAGAVTDTDVPVAGAGLAGSGGSAARATPADKERTTVERRRAPAIRTGRDFIRCDRTSSQQRKRKPLKSRWAPISPHCDRKTVSWNRCGWSRRWLARASVFTTPASCQCSNNWSSSSFREA